MSRILAILLLAIVLGSSAYAGPLYVFDWKGTAVMPLSYFADWLGVPVEAQGPGRWRITCAGGESLTVAEHRTTALMGTKVAAMPLAAAPLEGEVYVPIRFTAEALGFYVVRTPGEPSVCICNRWDSPHTPSGVGGSALGSLSLPISPTIGNPLSPLHLDIRSNRLEAARKRIAAGADLEARDGKGRTPLYWAVDNASLDFVKLLLENGAMPGAADNAGWSPLHVAARWGATEKAELLIAHGAVVDAPDNAGRTPLHLAAMNGNLAAMKVLLAHGATVDARDADGATPLHLAARGGFLEGMHALVAVGADVNARDTEGRTPLYLVAMMALDAENIQGGSFLVQMARRKANECADLLINAGADVNATTNNGQSIPPIPEPDATAPPRPLF
jgi:hypothetical protein